MQDVVHVSTGDVIMNLCLAQTTRVRSLINRLICILGVNIINRSIRTERRLKSIVITQLINYTNLRRCLYVTYS